MTTTGDERELWRIEQTVCVMVSCCAGAELQLRERSEGGDQIVLRELYPMKSDLYQRARALQAEWARSKK